MDQKSLVIFLSLASLLAFGLSERSASAGIWIQAAASATQTTETVNGEDVSDVRIVSNSTVGYSFLQGFVLGVQGLTARNSLNGDFSYAWGPKGGLLLKGFELTAAYLPVGRRLIHGSSFSGAGFAVNLGYTFKLFSHFRAGFMGTYWSTTFSQADGQDQAIRPRSAYLSPQLSLALDF